MRTLQLKTPEVFIPLTRPSRYKGAHGGRGSGKSHFYAEQMIARTFTVPKLRAVCLREIQNSLKQSVKLLIEDKIESLNLGQHFRVLETEIQTRTGGVIIFQGMQNHTAESLKSLQGYDIAWFEEAQSMSAFSLGLLRPTLRKPRSEMWFSWNPRSDKDPIDAFLRSKDRPADAIVVETFYYMNPWLPKVLRVEMEYDKRRDQDRYSHVWLGKYQKASEARVFRNWKIEDFETPKDARFYFGGDFGFATDPTVAVRCFIQGKTLFVDQEAWKVGCEMDHTPALFAGSDVARDPPRWLNPYKWTGIPEILKWPMVCDSANPQAISYLKRRGFDRVRPSIKGPSSIEDGLSFLKSYDIVVHSRCEHVISELSEFSYKIDKRTEEILPVLEEDKNHTIDSLRYAVEPLRKSSGNAITYSSPGLG
jgi:phage terminase large subunit